MGRKKKKGGAGRGAVVQAPEINAPGSHAASGSDNPPEDTGPVRETQWGSTWVIERVQAGLQPSDKKHWGSETASEDTRSQAPISGPRPPGFHQDDDSEDARSSSTVGMVPIKNSAGNIIGWRPSQERESHTQGTGALGVDPWQDSQTKWADYWSGDGDHSESVFGDQTQIKEPQQSMKKNIKVGNISKKVSQESSEFPPLLSRPPTQPVQGRPQTQPVQGRPQTQPVQGQPQNSWTRSLLGVPNRGPSPAPPRGWQDPSYQNVPPVQLWPGRPHGPHDPQAIPGPGSRPMGYRQPSPGMTAWVNNPSYRGRPPGTSPSYQNNRPSLSSGAVPGPRPGVSYPIPENSEFYPLSPGGVQPGSRSLSSGKSSPHGSGRSDRVQASGTGPRQGQGSAVGRGQGEGAIPGMVVRGGPRRLLESATSHSSDVDDMEPSMVRDFQRKSGWVTDSKPRTLMTGGLYPGIGVEDEPHGSAVNTQARVRDWVEEFDPEDVESLVSTKMFMKGGVSGKMQDTQFPSHGNRDDGSDDDRLTSVSGDEGRGQGRRQGPIPGTTSETYSGQGTGQVSGSNTRQIADVDSDNDDEDEYDDDDEDYDEDYDEDFGDADFVEGQSDSGYVHCKEVLDFFYELEQVYTAAELADEEKEWKCRVCTSGAQDGCPGKGATKWWKGFGALVGHASTMKKLKAKAHRMFVKDLKKILEARRVTVSTLAGPVTGYWKAPEIKRVEVKDRVIMWPPVIIVTNTRLYQEGDKWIGMGMKDLQISFSQYTYIKERKHCYGPEGHRGMSALVFQSSPDGYEEAVDLSRQFREDGKGKNDWQRRRPGDVVQPDGKRPLYGWLASEEDLRDFNHSHKGKQIVSAKMVSWKEAVEEPRRRQRELSEQAKASEMELLRLREENQELMRNMMAMKDLIEYSAKVQNKNKTQYDMKAEEASRLKNQVQLSQIQLRKREVAMEKLGKQQVYQQVDRTSKNWRKNVQSSDTASVANETDITSDWGDFKDQEEDSSDNIHSRHVLSSNSDVLNFAPDPQGKEKIASETEDGEGDGGVLSSSQGSIARLDRDLGSLSISKYKR